MELGGHRKGWLMDTQVFNNLDAAGALKVAIQSEIDAYHMFHEAWEESSSDDSRRLLRTLAEEELQHRRVLEEEYAELTGKRLRNVNLMHKRRLFNTLVPDQPPLKILESALRDEGASLRFYQQLAKEVRDRSARLMFEKLAQQEQEYMELLQAEHEVRTKEEKHRARPRRRPAH